MKMPFENKISNSGFACNIEVLLMFSYISLIGYIYIQLDIAVYKLLVGFSCVSKTNQLQML